MSVNYGRAASSGVAFLFLLLRALVVGCMFGFIRLLRQRSRWSFWSNSECCWWAGRGEPTSEG